MGNPELLPGGGPSPPSRTVGTRDREKAADVFRQECLSLTKKVGLSQAAFQYVPSHLQVFLTGHRGGVRSLAAALFPT